MGINEVVRSHAEPCGGYLLYGTAAKIAPLVGLEAFFVFSALARVGFAADPIHSDSQSFVGFLADRSERHGAGGKAFHNFLRGLYFFERYRLVTLLQLHQAAEGAKVRTLFIDEVRVLLKRFVAILPHRLLQLADG